MRSTVFQIVSLPLSGGMSAFMRVLARDDTLLCISLSVAHVAIDLFVVNVARAVIFLTVIQLPCPPTVGAFWPCLGWRTANKTLSVTYVAIDFFVVDVAGAVIFLAVVQLSCPTTVGTFAHHCSLLFS